MLATNLVLESWALNGEKSETLPFHLNCRRGGSIRTDADGDVHALCFPRHRTITKGDLRC